MNLAFSPTFCVATLIFADDVFQPDVYPNISEIGREEFKVGNLLNHSFEDIWNGEIHKSVKDTSDKQWQAGMCKNCRAISYNLLTQNMVGHLPCEEDPFI